MKKLICAIITVILAFSATACQSKSEPYTNNDEYADSELPQFQKPKSGETIVVIETSMGTIKARLFPRYAPMAVLNFMTLANEKYYDNSIFHRVINQFMIQGGAPGGLAYGGESIWGEPFQIEVSQNLSHISGALCMAKGEADVSIGSQFYIVSNNDLDKYYTDGSAREELQYYLDNMDSVITTDENNKQWFVRDFLREDLVRSYLKNGGAYHLDQSYTVFGQVFEGMNVVDAIQQVETSGSSASVPNKPVTDVKIISIRTEVYK